MKSFGVCLVLSCICTPPISANALLDQEYVASSDFGWSLDYAGDYMAQTFTVRSSGQLTGVGVQLSIWGNSASRFSVTDDMHLRIVQTDSGGLPAIDHVLAAHTISRFDIPFRTDSVPILDVDTTNDNVSVHVGDVLAIVLSSSFLGTGYPSYQSYVWHTSVSDSIPGGLFCVYSPPQFGPTPLFRWDLSNPTVTRDAGYRLSVSVPEPCATIFVKFGILLVAWSRKRRNR